MSLSSEICHIGLGSFSSAVVSTGVQDLGLSESWVLGMEFRSWVTNGGDDQPMLSQGRGGLGSHHQTGLKPYVQELDYV